MGKSRGASLVLDATWSLTRHLFYRPFRVWQIWGRERTGPGLPHAIWSTPSPLHFLREILYGWTQPPKNAFLRPPETRTTGTNCPPTLQAGPRYPRGRACPVGWPSAAPIPVDAGHPVWGGRAAVWRRPHTKGREKCPCKLKMWGTA